MDTNERELRKGIIWNRSRLVPVVLVIGLLLSILAACSSNVPADFTTNRNLWESKKIVNYNFTLQRNCFCPEDVRGPVNVQVRNGAPVSVTYTATGDPAKAEYFNDFDTIPELFTTLKKAYDGKAERVDVTYDGTNGYPRTIYIDESTLIADEEQGYEVTNFSIVQ